MVTNTAPGRLRSVSRSSSRSRGKGMPPTSHSSERQPESHNPRIDSGKMKRLKSKMTCLVHDLKPSRPGSRLAKWQLGEPLEMCSPPPSAVIAKTGRRTLDRSAQLIDCERFRQHIDVARPTPDRFRISIARD